MGHLGLTPQSVHAMGGFKVQGRSTAPPWSWSPTPRRWPPPAASPSCSRACPTRWPAWSPTPSTSPPSASAPAPAPTARCSCTTTSSASRTASCRSSCAATPTLKAAGVDALAAYAADVRSGAFPGRGRDLPPQRRRRRDAGPLRPGAHRRLTARPSGRGTMTADARRRAGSVAAWRCRRARRRRARGAFVAARARTGPPTPSSAPSVGAAVADRVAPPGDPDRGAARRLRRGRHHRRPGRRQRPAGLVPARRARPRSSAAGASWRSPTCRATPGWCSSTRRTSPTASTCATRRRPLSIAWVDADGDVVTHRPTWSRARTATAARPTRPPGRYRYAIEAFQGDLDDLGITEAATVTVGGALRRPRPRPSAEPARCHTPLRRVVDVCRHPRHRYDRPVNSTPCPHRGGPGSAGSTGRMHAHAGL